jgi:2-methylcitrate dehydratase PrpD
LAELTARLARFVAEERFERIPPAAVETAKTAILDSLGVALAGSREESGGICARLARAEEARQEASLYGQGFKSSALQAAFVNGVATHAADFDYSFVVSGQPTAPIVPAVMALGDSLGASGSQVIAAFAAGFEVTARLALAVAESEGGWHANGVLGAFGATAGCCKLLGASAGQVETGLSLTASMASGLRANFGTMAKPLHVGLAARKGLLAAKLATSGFSANGSAFDAAGGFFETYYGLEPELDRFEDLGRDYALEKHGIRLKPYPCGGLTHTALLAALELRSRHGLTDDLIEHVDVEVSPNVYSTIAFRVPETALQGKFCMGYLIARALIDGTITLATFTEEAIRDRRVLALLERVTMRANPDFKPGQDGSRPANVSIRLTSGETHDLQLRFPKGGPDLPMTPSEIEAKFRDCAHGVIAPDRCQEALEQLSRLERLATVTPLAGLLSR